MSAPNLAIILGSTRPARLGLPVAQWFDSFARLHGGFEVEFIDLAAVQLPMFDEPRHPKLGQYEHQHTKDWSATISRADAFVFITPEYNHSFSAALKNAIDFLHREWAYKPAGILSYGGIVSGSRAAEALKLVLIGLRMVPLFEAVHVRGIEQVVVDGVYHVDDSTIRAADVMLAELARWAAALNVMRETAPPR